MKKVVWFMGPEVSRWNGVSKYSEILIENIKSEYDVETIFIPYAARSLMRYIYQFFYFSWLVAKGKRDVIYILYQEDISFLAFIGKLFGKKILSICHHVPKFSGDSSSITDRIKVLYLKITFIFLTFSNKVIIPSETTKADIVKLNIIKENRLCIIHNCFVFSDSIDSNKLDNLKRNFSLPPYGDKIMILNVGTNEHRKNLTNWLKAYSKIDKDKYVFIQIGKTVDFSEFEEQKKLIDEHELNALFLGYVDESELILFYKLACFYISPSLHEGFGRTVIEAQFNNALVIASDLPVYKEIMGDTFIKVSNPELPSSWENIISEISICDDILYRAKLNSMNYSADVVSRKFSNLLKGIISDC
jgi:glycosyltransferase involved in cell wall biosynthesis